MLWFSVSSWGGVVEPLRADDPRIVGSYRLLGRLGAGGMGRVFLGESPGGRKVAVKLLLPEHAADAEFRQRFAREVAAARQVGGFHTAPVVDADPAADPPWMVTAYIPGPSLDAAIRANGPLDPAAVQKLGAALAEGLAAVHACGLVHRDLKPGNIIMADDGPRIIDFGIARAADATALTSSGVLIGTFSFMSPEQVRAEHVGPASDVFSLGSVLAYAATGRGPFDASTIPAVIHRIAADAPDLRGVSGPLHAVISACLTKDPAGRPSLADLIGFLLGSGRRTHSARQSSSPASPATGATMTAAPAPVSPAPAARRPAASVVSPAPAARRPAASVVSPAPAARRPAERSRPPTRRRGSSFGIVGGIVLSAALVAGIVLAISMANGGSGTPASDEFSVPASRGVLALAISDRGQALMADGYGKTSAGLWDANTDRRIFTLPAPDGAEVYSESFSPDGRVLATGDSNGDIYFWNTATGKRTGRFREPSVGNGITSLAYSGDASHLAAVDANGAAYVWNTVTGALAKFPADPKNGGSMEVAISRDGKLIATGDGYGHIHVWDVATRTEVSSFEDPGGLGISDLSMSPDGKLLAGSNVGEGNTYLWNTATGKLVSTVTQINGGTEVESVEFSPDGKLLAVGASANILLWNADANKVQAELGEQNGSGGYVLAFSQDGRAVAAVDGPDGSVTVRVWDLPTS